MAIVTISRQVGSGGSEIARNLASRLGFELLDRRGLETMLPSYGLVEHELLDLGGLPEDPGQLGRLRPQSLPPGRQLLNISAIKINELRMTEKPMSESTELPDGIGEILLEEETLAHRAAELGKQISGDYAGLEQPLLMIGILKGCFVFLGDLCRAISTPVEIELMAVTSYGSKTESSGRIRITKDLDVGIAGRHVLLVEGIVDTGLTLHYLLTMLQARKPQSLQVCTLLDKPARRLAKIEIAYTGFQIPDRFVVGYGMDYDQRFRNLPYIAVIDE